MAHNVTERDLPAKFCPRCERTKSVLDFPLSSAGTHGRYGYCKSCKTAYMRERRLQMKEDGRQALENLKRVLKRYGKTIEWWDVRVARQGNKCLICGGPPTGMHNRLCVDHNHETNEARGLICGDCNNGLGMFKDNADVLRRAADYIEKDGDI